MSLRFRHLIPLLAAAACVGESPPESATPDAATAAEAAAPAAPPPAFAAGEVIVKLHDAYDGGAPLTIGGRRMTPIERLPSGTWRMQLDSNQRRAQVDLATDTLDALEVIKRDAAVEYAHVNAIFELSAQPNDPQAQQWVGAQSWSLQQINMYDAWDLTTGSSAVRVAVIDTGRREHPELVSQWGPGRGFIAGNTSEIDTGTWAHGIHVAGIIGAQANNSLGGAGLCWNCKVLPYRITGSLTTLLSEVESAIAYAAGDDGQPIRAEVINMSFNHPSMNDCNDVTFTGLRQQIDRATTRGVSLVASAGNIFLTTPPPNTRPRVPATCAGVISSMATNPIDSTPAYTAIGIGVDVAAPGGGDDLEHYYGSGVDCPSSFYGEGTTGVFSSWSFLSGGQQHCFRHLSGTSMASPHVAGVVALMRSVRSNLTPAQTKAVIRLTASPGQSWQGWGFLCGTGLCGAGRLDARAAIDAINDGTPAIAETAPNYHDFGTVTGSATRTVSLRNIGLGSALTSTGAMQLVGSPWFRFGGSCTGTSCNQTYSLPTGASINTQVICQPTGADTQYAELVYSNNSVGQARVQLSCTGVASGNLVVPPSLPVGNVRVNTSTFVGLPLQNTGSAPLTVTNVTFNHSVFTLGSAMPQTINAGGTFNAIVYCTPTAVTTYTATITVASSVGNRTLPVTCSGVAPLISVVPSPVTFGSTPVGSSVDRVVTISNAGGAPLAISSWSLTAPYTLVTAVPTSIAANSSGTVTIRCTPPGAGTYIGVFRLGSDAINATTLDTSLSCTGAIGIPTVLPNPLAFGGVYVGTPADRTVTVRNDGNAPLTISDAFVVAGSTCARVGALPPTLAPAASGTFTVRCTPPTEGTHSATLRVVTDGGNVDVPVSVTGIISRIAVSPPAIDFGIVEVGGRVTRDVTITSTGTAALSITSIVASGGAFSIANQSATLPPGATLTVAPRCSPFTTGTVTGWIEVRSNAGDRRVDLTCTGGQAQLTAPTWIDLPDVLLGSATTATFTVSNPGNVPLAITSAAITGGNGFSFTGLPSSLAPGASATVTLRCSPSVAGYFSGSLQIASNAATSPTSIGIGCRAATGRITVLAGANLELGWCESGTVTIQNSGVGPLGIAELHFTNIGMSTSGIALPATLAAGEIASWQVDCDCWKPGFSIGAKHYAKHDGVQEGSFAAVTCGVENGGGDTIELPIDPPPATE